MAIEAKNFVFDYGDPDSYASELYHYSGLAEKIDGFDAVTDDQLAIFGEEGKDVTC